MPQQPQSSKHSQFVSIVNGLPVIDVGAMRHLVTVQQETLGTSYDSAGVSESTWTAVGSGNAAVGTAGVKPGTDVIRGGQTGTQLFMEVAMYYVDCPSLQPNMQIVSDNGSTYVIQAAENVLEMNWVWVLRCLALGSNV